MAATKLHQAAILSHSLSATLCDTELVSTKHYSHYIPPSIYQLRPALHQVSMIYCLWLSNDASPGLYFDKSFAYAFDTINLVTEGGGDND